MDHQEVQPPPHLPTDAAAFFGAGPDLELLVAVPLPEQAQHVLEQLGPPPFRKTTFPMMGFLSSVYEHVATHVGMAVAPGEAPGEALGEAPASESEPPQMSA